MLQVCTARARTGAWLFPILMIWMIWTGTLASSRRNALMTIIDPNSIELIVHLVWKTTPHTHKTKSRRTVHETAPGGKPAKLRKTGQLFRSSYRAKNSNTSRTHRIATAEAAIDLHLFPSVYRSLLQQLLCVHQHWPDSDHADPCMGRAP